MDIILTVKDVIVDIVNIISDTSTKKDEKASLIVGATMMRNDYHDLIKCEPMILDIAEMSADFEVYYPIGTYDDEDYEAILNKIEIIRNKYK